jgi:hypothetical protein
MLLITRPTGRCERAAFLTEHDCGTLNVSLGCFLFVACSLSHTD